MELLRHRTLIGVAAGAMASGLIGTWLQSADMSHPPRRKNHAVDKGGNEKPSWQEDSHGHNVLYSSDIMLHKATK